MGQSHAILCKRKVDRVCMVNWGPTTTGLPNCRSVVNAIVSLLCLATAPSIMGRTMHVALTYFISVLTFHCLLSFLQVSRKRWQGRKAHIFLEWMHAPLSGVSCKVWRQRLVGAMNVVVQLLLVG